MAGGVEILAGRFVVLRRLNGQYALGGQRISKHALVGLASSLQRRRSSGLAVSSYLISAMEGENTVRVDRCYLRQGSEVDCVCYGGICSRHLYKVA